MNLINRLFGKKEAKQQEIAFEELSGWLEPGSEKVLKEAVKGAASVFSRIEKALAEIKKSNDELERAQPVGKFHLKMVKITTSNRDNMVKQVKMLIDNISVPGSIDVKTIRAFHEYATHNLVVCLDNMMKSHQYAKIVYPEASKELIVTVNVLRRLLDELIEPLNEKNKLIDAFEKADNTIQAIKQTLSGIGKGEKSITGLEESIALLKNQHGKTQESLALLRESGAWKQYLEAKDELVLLEEKANDSEAKINALVLPLSAGLNRLKQLSESGRYTLSPETKHELHACCSYPKNTAPEFFTGFKSIIESDALNLSHDKKNKMLEQVNQVISSIWQLQENYSIAVKDVENKEKELSCADIFHEEKRIDNEIAALQDRIETSEKELETAKKQFTSLKDALVLEKHELQQVISFIDSNVRVSF